MKVTISMPDKLGKYMDREAKKRDMTRSAFVAEAVAAYGLNERASNITAQINRVVSNLEDGAHEGIPEKALRRDITRNEW